MRAACRLAARFRRSTSGSAAVEFALTVPALLLMLFGAIEFGRLLWTQNTIQYAVEQAARCAALYLTGYHSETESKTFAASKVHGYAVASTAFTVNLQCASYGTDKIDP